MKLYMIRHGQSMNNLSKCYTGWQQVELSPQGKEEAKEVGMALRDISFGKVYSSDLIRAIQTQQLALPGIKAIQTPLLREVDVGDLAGIPIEECREKHPELRQIRSGFAAYGGESYETFYTRLRQFLKQMEQAPVENVAAFCHLGVIRGVINIVSEGAEAPAVPLKNCGIFVFHYENGKWSFEA